MKREQVGTVEITARNPFKRLLIAFLLWLVSFVLKYVIAAISGVVMPLVYIFSFKWKTGINALADWLWRVALSNDQHGNVTNDKVLQLFLTKKESFKFGDPDDTISYIVGRNKFRGTLTALGRGLANLLDKIDSTAGGHILKAIHMKKQADIKARDRHVENKYFE